MSDKGSQPIASKSIIDSANQIWEDKTTASNVEARETME